VLPLCYHCASTARQSCDNLLNSENR
jgi:hypothetical protein